MSRRASIVALVSLLLPAALAAKDIDWAFISDQEGGQQLKGYVPNAEGSKSGVTIATGFDLGQRTENDLVGLGLDPKLIDRFKPYLGLKQQAARDYLAKHPLSISKAEADSIDTASKDAAVKALVKAYDAAVAAQAGLKPFAQLPGEAQTVIASVAFQYGDLKTRTPSFWKYVTQQDWKSAVRELYNFKDAYESRRFQEGDLLARQVPDLPKITASVGKNGTNNAADVKVVQGLLKEKKVYSGEISGTCDNATIQAIEAFQKQIGLPSADGLVQPGKKTMRRLVAF